jgi:hypothetical protein
VEEHKLNVPKGARLDVSIELQVVVRPRIVIDEGLAGNAMPEIEPVAGMHLIRREHKVHANHSFTIKWPMSSAKTADPKFLSGDRLQC